MTAALNNDAEPHLRAKTASLLEKYGPGPHVSYHIGLFRDTDTDTDPTVPLTEIQRRITAAQTALIDYGAQFWEAAECLSGKVVDIGCGLGGGSLYWAQNHHADVTAITNVAEHAELVGEFAAQCGVPDRVHPLVVNAEDLPADLDIDGAVAMESMCYMRRQEVIGRLGQILPAGAALCVQDVFLANERWKADFDRYWKTDIGTIGEYITLAEAAGLECDREEDISDGTTEFWIQSLAWNEGKLRLVPSNSAEYARLLQSIRWHAAFLRAWRDHAIHVGLLRFRKA